MLKKLFILTFFILFCISIASARNVLEGANGISRYDLDRGNIAFLSQDNVFTGNNTFYNISILNINYFNGTICDSYGCYSLYIFNNSIYNLTLNAINNASKLDTTNTSLGLVITNAANNASKLDILAANTYNTTQSDEIDLAESSINNPNLRAYYKFNNNLKDYSGNNINGSCDSAASCPSFVRGLNGKAINCDGNDFVNLSNNPAILNFSSFTISFWVNASSLTNAMISNWRGDPTQITLLIRSNFQIYMRNTSNIQVGGATGNTIGNNKWAHVAVLYNGTHLYSYINLVKGTTTYATIGMTQYNNPSSLTVCGGSGASENYFTGQIDELRIYNKTLTESELRTIYGIDSQTSLLSEVNGLTTATNVQFNAAGIGVTNTVAGTVLANKYVRSGNGVLSMGTPTYNNVLTGNADWWINYNNPDDTLAARTFYIADGQRAAIATFTGSTKATSLAANLAVAGNTTLSARVGVNGAPLPNVALNVGGLVNVTGYAFGMNTAALTLAPGFPNQLAIFGYFGGGTVDTSAGDISSASGFYIEHMTKTGPNNITTAYGLVIQNQTIGLTNWGIYNVGTSYFGDNVKTGGNLGVGGTATCRQEIFGNSLAQGAPGVETELQITRNVNSGVSWPQIFSVGVGRYRNISVSDLSPYSRVDFNLKNSSTSTLIADTTVLTLQSNGNIGIGVTSPNATLHLKRGTAANNSAPLKFSNGSLLGIAEVGAVEFLNDKLYATISTGSVRKEFTLNDISLTPGRIPFTTTNGRLVDSPNLAFDNTTLQITGGGAASVYLLGSGGDEKVTFADNGSSNVWSVGFSQSADFNDFGIHLGGIEKFTVEADGDVQVINNLDVAHNLTVHDLVRINENTDGASWIVGITGSIIQRSGNVSLGLNSGDVGIGLSNPSHKLDVNGTVRVSANLTANGLIVNQSKICLDGAPCTKYMFYNGSAVIIQG